MLKINGTIYLSLLFKFILTERLHNSLLGSDVSLFVELINIVAFRIITLYDSLYCYILFK